MRTEEKIENAPAEQPASFGGYSARQGYEKKDKRTWQISLLAALFLLLLLLSVVGLVALFRGTLFTASPTDGQNGSGKVTVPVVNDTVPDTPEEAVEEAEKALVTVEVKLTDGAVSRGTGFVVSREGYAVCHSSLFEGGLTASVMVYTADGSLVEAETMGNIPSLGVAVIRLHNGLVYDSVTLGSSNFVKRGQRLFGVANTTRGVFNGLVQEGVAVSTAESVAVSIDGEYNSLSILYTSVPYDETLRGALLITEAGNAAGFLTDAVEGRGGGMAAVPIITLIGLVNEVINAN